MYIPDYLTKLTNVAKASIVAGTNDALTDIKVAWDEWNTHAWNFEKDKNDCNYTLKNTILTASILHSFTYLNCFPECSDSVMNMLRRIWREKYTVFRKSLIILTEKQKRNLRWMQRAHREL